MEKINFENGTKVKSPYVVIDEVEHEVKPGEYTGNTPLSPYTLNLMQENIEKSCVVVSSTEPTTEEKVWIQKGKNLLSKDNVFNLFMGANETNESLAYNNYALTTGWVKCEPNKSYVISGGYNRARWQTKAENGAITYVGEGTTITTNSTAKYMRCYFYVNEDQTAISPSNCPDVQIEPGTIATPYEEYIEPKIYVKNDNGVYEEFMEKEDKRNAISYFRGPSWASSFTVNYLNNYVPKLVFINWGTSQRVYVIYFDKVIVLGENIGTSSGVVDTCTTSINSSARTVTFTLSNTGIIYTIEFPTHPTL